MIAISIVSHGHGSMVIQLLESAIACEEVGQIILTFNIPEQLDLPSDMRLLVIRNDQPKGFSANHNSAFIFCTQPFFCPLNPDIRLRQSPFPELLFTIERTRSAMVAPLIFSTEEKMEDSVRHFPTLRSLLIKLLTGQVDRCTFNMHQDLMHPEWVGGMFMLFRSEAFAQLGGFDEGFFLYYEDVDICVRAWKSGLPIVVCQKASVIHDARRDSHRNLKHFRWHFMSMLRYFWKHWWRLPKVPLRDLERV